MASNLPPGCSEMDPYFWTDDTIYCGYCQEELNGPEGFETCEHCGEKLSDHKIISGSEVEIEAFEKAMEDMAAEDRENE